MIFKMHATLLITNTARLNFVKDILNSNGYNPNKLWSTLKTLMPGKKNKNPKNNNNNSNNITLLDSSNALIIDPFITADYANNKFANIGVKLAKALTSDKSDELKILDETTLCDFPLEEFQVIGHKEFTDVIKAVDITKASNLIDINTRLFKDCQSVWCHSFKMVSKALYQIMPYFLTS